MMKIAICDEENFFRDYIEELVSNYMNKIGVQCEIEIFISSKDLISLEIEMAKYTIIFLDVNLSELDGIKTAQRIRKVSKKVFIVFVTACTDYILEGYKVEAIRYLLKNNANFEETINECMDTIAEKINNVEVKKEFKFKDGVRQINLSRILYIESRLHKLEFYVLEDNSRRYTLYETLNKIENKVEGNGFIRIHQSFLVNMKYIKSMTRYEVMLMNGKTLVIPKARYKYVKDMFIAYKGNI